MLNDLAWIVVKRRAMVDRKISKRAEIRLKGSDISARDNAGLAVAASTIINAFSIIRDRGLIDDAELMRMAYRFAGEVVDIEDLLKRGQAAPKVAPQDLETPLNPPNQEVGAEKEGGGASLPKVEIDTGTGEPKDPGLR